MHDLGSIIMTEEIQYYRDYQIQTDCSSMIYAFKIKSNEVLDASEQTIMKYCILLNNI